MLPERAADDLPRAIEAIQAHGLTVPMITTDLTSAAAPHARPLLEAAARGGVRYFKTGYWHYAHPTSARRWPRLAPAGGTGGPRPRLRHRDGVPQPRGYVGAALWDIAPAIDRLDPRWAGYYFDPRHAVAEGGGGAWKTATHLVAPRLKMVAVKDCFWERTAKGWRVENCPLGDGLVDWAWVGSR